MNNRDLYLIQRFTFKPNNSHTDIRRLVSADYMGSAEFEFGAVGKSWGSLRVMAANQDLDVCTVLLGDKPFYAIKNKAISTQDVQRAVTDIATGKILTKECSYWDHHLKSELPKYVAKTDCWMTVPYSRMFSDQIIFFTTNKTALKKILYELLIGDNTALAIKSDTYQHYAKPNAGVMTGSTDSVLRPYLSSLKG